MSQEQHPLRVLLTVRSEERRKETIQFLQNAYQSFLHVTEIELLQDTIEHLEESQKSYDLIICEQMSTSQSMVKLLLGLKKNAAVILLIPASLDPAAFSSLNPQPRFLANHEIEEELTGILKAMADTGQIPPQLVSVDPLYFSVSSDSLVGLYPLKSDVYVKLEQGNFVCLFKKGTTLEKADLKKYEENKAVDVFFIKKDECEATLQSHVKTVEALSAKPEITREEASEQFEKSFPIIRDVVTQVGFTPQAQLIAKSCITMSLKALGTRPRLVRILSELKKKQGNYIVGHSFMVGEVACALAYKIGWSSAPTFFKLSLAAFLHDITLSRVELARVISLADAKASGLFLASEIQTLILHPMKAAEYSRQFSEIPSDVDQILAQHHELPDGSGFPREMSGKNISPLSALFIMAHDLVDVFMDQPGMSFEAFFDSRAEHYNVGQFKKIMTALKTAETH